MTIKQKFIVVLFVVALFASPFVSLKVEPVMNVEKTVDGRYELTVTNYYCNMDISLDRFRTLKMDSTDVINETDTCTKCGRIFTIHETKGEYYRRSPINRALL